MDDLLLGEANELTCVDSLSEIQSKRIEVIDTLLENKLKSLKEIDQEILDICELTAVNNEVKESEEIVARIIDCQQKIKEVKRRQQMQQLPTVNVNNQIEVTLKKRKVRLNVKEGKDMRKFDYQI